MKRFKNKVVIVTGATSGIGHATAKMFAAEGAKVVCVGRSMERGREIARQIVDAGGEASFVRCDVSNEEQAKDMIEKTVREYGRIDVLFNNAGIMPQSTEIEKIPVEDWRTTFDINMNGIFFVTRYAKPHIVQTKGNIVNNASIAGMQHYAAGRSYAYSASKAAVIQFSHQMAKNYGEEGVRVNCICPGIVDTPILGDRNRSVYAERVPLKRLATPEDVAKVVLFLASDDAGYLTGVVLPIDGGVSL